MVVRLCTLTLYPMPDALPLVKGTLDILVLKALSWTPMHGFEITKWFESRSAGALDVRDSALYQALHRMEQRGLVVAEWGITENNQRARYYRLTRAGRTLLTCGRPRSGSLPQDGHRDHVPPSTSTNDQRSTMKDPNIRPGIRRLFRLAGRSDANREADDEIRLHLQLRIDELVASGMSPDEARAEAERRFGSVDEERARFAADARRRDDRVRFREWFESVAQDARYALRTLRRDLGFTMFAVLIVGLGIGASATVFSLVNGILLRPMPFRDPSRLIWIANISDDGVSEWRLEADHVADLAARNRTLEGLAGYYAYYSGGNAPLTIAPGDVERVTRVPVTCDFLPFLGVAPVVGRSFTPEECMSNSAPVMIMTEGLWRARFAADRSIVGRTVTVGDRAVTVVGVAPASFDFPSVFAPGTQADYFTPFPLDSITGRSGNSLAIVGRLKPGVSISVAREDLAAIGKQLMEEYPKTRNTLRIKIQPLDERINGAVRPALIILGWAVIAVMLIVSANLASLQHARTSARHREMAVRAALGAARGRLVRQALTESLVLAAGGALLGMPSARDSRDAARLASQHVRCSFRFSRVLASMGACSRSRPSRRL